MLDPQEEYMLAKRWREHGDRDAAQKLITSHLRLAAKIAMGYCGYPSGDALLRNPTTGIAGCCARATTGHAAAPPSDELSPFHSITSSAAEPNSACIFLASPRKLMPRAMPGLVTHLALQIQYCASRGEHFCTAIVGQQAQGDYLVAWAPKHIDAREVTFSMTRRD
jgi:hypothetical protein